MAIMTRFKKVAISVFAALWLLVFHYESLRAMYLDPWVGVHLPKIKFLFPPAGWIMFFEVDESHSQAEVYAQDGGRLVLLDPHSIFKTRYVGYDNIRRNILLTVLSPDKAPTFCPYLRRKFPQYKSFVVAYRVWPSVVRNKNQTVTRPIYLC